MSLSRVLTTAYCVHLLITSSVRYCCSIPAVVLSYRCVVNCSVPARLPACLRACLRACVCACLPARLPARVAGWLAGWLAVSLSLCLSVSLCQERFSYGVGDVLAARCRGG